MKVNLVYILHLEDNADDAEIIAETLRSGGISCQIDRVDRRETFLAALGCRAWDAILADCSLPSFDGLSALATARERCPDTPFIIVSAALDEEVAVEMLKSGAADYVLKDRLARLPLVLNRALERRVALEARKGSEALLSLRTKALESAANGVVITDRQGTIIWANPACTTLTGYTPAELVGHNPRLLNAQRQDRTFYHNLWRTILQGRVWHGEMTNRRKDGRLYTEEQTITPVRDAQGEITAFIAIKQDITARKELEQQLLRSQKLEAVGCLAAGVAHDFNNLLTVIIGYSNMPLVNPGAPVAQCLEQIKAAAESAAALVRQLLMFSRREVVLPRILNLNNTVSKMEKMLLSVLGEKIELVTLTGSALGSVKADPTQMEQIVINLAINAADSMPEGGRLLIETANVNLDESACQTETGAKPGHYVMLRVEDNGRGMSEEVKAHVFEPFFTTKDKSTGSGLGLSSVYGIVKQSGGFITAESAPGQGSTFCVYLPLVEGLAEAIQPPTDRQPESTESRVVLLVEDELSVRTLVRSILELDGYTVLESSDPDQALVEYGLNPYKSSNRIDLLLADIVMPHMSGIELAKLLLPLHPKMKVIYMSGYSDELLKQHGIRSLSTLSFIPKPFTPAELLSKVQEALSAGTTQLSNEITRTEGVDIEPKVSCTNSPVPRTLPEENPDAHEPPVKPKT